MKRYDKHLCIICKMKGQADGWQNGNREQMAPAFTNQYRFDVEIGYLVSSPCRGCPRRDEFPQCAEACEMLDKIQTLLSETISCSRRT